MARLLSNLVLVVTFLTIGGSCYDGMKIGDLPTEATQEELIYMLKHYPDIKVNCTGHPTARSAEFRLYNRQRPDNPIMLDGNNLNEIDANKDAVMIIHGIFSKATNKDILDLKDAYIKRYDNNIITVDWSQQSFQQYTKSYCDTKGIARIVQQLLCTIVNKIGMPLSKFHVLGHNHGGHIAGFAGQFVVNSCKQHIGRITGLDPSGPGFWLLDEGERLDKSDAAFVDVIHTDEMSIGSPKNSGDVDFHPNCGLLQPDCPSMSNANTSTPMEDALCSTIRAMKYMHESITSNQFIGISCSLCARYCRPDIINEVYTVMGEECRTIPKPGYNFYISTNGTPPYAQGWDAYPKIETFTVANYTTE